MGVKPTRIFRPRELLSVESIVGDVSGTDVDWGTSPIGIPAASGRDQWKQPVRVASTASVTVSTALNNGDTIDGVTLATGDRVLLKDQSTGSQNGIYIVGATPIRAADMDDDDEVLGALVYVIAGSTNTATAWKVTNTAAVTVGSTSIVFAAFGTGGSASFATPAIVLGSSAAAGAASTVIRSDSTIAAFDATVPVTQAYSDTAATGSAAFAARRDHRHGMPASSGGGGTAADPVNDLFGTADSAFEFSTNSLAGLTAMGSPATENANTTVPGNYYIKDATASTSWQGRYIASPAHPFTAVIKITGSNERLNYNGVALFVGTSTPGKMVCVDTGTKTRTIGVDIFTNPTTYSSTPASDITNETSFPCYFGLVTVSTTSVSYYFSQDGYVWMPILTGHNGTLTIGSVGFAAKSENAAGHAAAIDFFRVWNSSKTFPGS